MRDAGGEAAALCAFAHKKVDGGELSQKNFSTNVKNVRSDEKYCFRAKSKNKFLSVFWPFLGIFWSLLHKKAVKKAKKTPKNKQKTPKKIFSIFLRKQYFFHCFEHFLRLSKNFDNLPQSAVPL